VSERFVLFVRPRDREMEIWNGRRAGVEGAVAQYGADAAYPIDRLDAKLREYALDRPRILYRLGNAQHDPRVARLVTDMRGPRTRGFPTPLGIEDPGPLLHELRLRRSDEELERQRRACRISRDAHLEAMRYAEPGSYEYEVQAALEFVFKKEGAPRNAYPSIVASGPNACILHYSENNRRMEDGDLLLIDAACEWGYFAADITRTFPVNGRFTPAQRRIYEVVLEAQLAAIDAAQAGARYETMHEIARRRLTEGLIGLGLLPCGLDDSVAMHHYREFYMHGTGHWLGMDVHDVGDYRIRRESRTLEPGMVMTVEPGLYFDPERASATFHLRPFSEEEMWERRFRLGMEAARKIEEKERAAAPTVEHPIPEEYRGIGIRIEDDILVTPSGPENLTAETPKTIDEIERACAEPSRLR
jgi:Xaa-Pro aminopeptidase